MDDGVEEILAEDSNGHFNPTLEHQTSFIQQGITLQNPNISLFIILANVVRVRLKLTGIWATFMAGVFLNTVIFMQ